MKAQTAKITFAKCGLDQVTLAVVRQLFGSRRFNLTGIKEYPSKKYDSQIQYTNFHLKK